MPILTLSFLLISILTIHFHFHIINISFNIFLGITCLFHNPSPKLKDFFFSISRCIVIYIETCVITGCNQILHLDCNDRGIRRNIVATFVVSFHNDIKMLVVILAKSPIYRTNGDKCTPFG